MKTNYRLALAAFAVLTLMMSACKVHKGCEAYSKVEVKAKAERI